ncbi:MAG: radical SAM family RiPP maturation amino acid epimerase [Alphaproteobacteria bacterium]|nr:radical SAM family RiPP maturation amino acid epimerase [Alphaproteobacteria bacterium]
MKRQHQASDSTKHYQRIFTSRSEEELRVLAHVKRFMERLSADETFRAKLREHVENPIVVSKEYGINVDPMDLLPMWHTKYAKHRHTDEMSRWPKAKAWDDYLAEMIANRDLIRDAGNTEKSNPRFHAWRERQMRRSASELGVSADSVVHAIVAYELSQGCSVGCWFCGLSAEKFQGNYPYTPENAALWRKILQVMVDLFGPASQTGFCYWATDPVDNPDYPKFIEDHYRITGHLPQTTTAVPLKNLELTRKVMALHKKYCCITQRFSILSTKVLDRVYDTFTPEEIMGVELVMQGKDAFMSKAKAGRAEERREKLRAAGKDDKISKIQNDHATIACVSGFLINMVTKTVQLVTPTRASPRWPLGYRIYAEARFTTAAEFRAVVEGMVDVFMPESVPAGEVLSFRHDLEFSALSEGFELEGRGMKYSCNGMSYMGRLGRLIHESRTTASDVIGELVSGGEDIFLVGQSLQSLYDNGLLDDDLGREGAASAG